MIKRVAVIRGEIEDAHDVGGHQAAAEAEAARLLAIADAEKLAQSGTVKIPE